MRQKLDILRQATQRLVEHGFLEGEERLDGQVHYRIAAARVPEIRALLDAEGDPGADAATGGAC